jgi:hypothetical protein
MMHTFRSHNEDGLRRSDQSEARPDRCNPYPLVGFGADGVRVHIEIVFYGAAERPEMQRIAETVQ